MTDDAPTFDIPRRPQRSFPREGGVEYEGGTVFHLSPDSEADDGELAALVEGVLEDDRYTYGDWFELPKPVYLVHDERHGTAFRVVVRYGRVEFHVLPETASAALRTLYARLREESDCAWRVDCETTGVD
ncbi:hypothetical protein NGM10_15815 (plasmid) [Halorussus salilacus]|uniref:hypothetical protein n=1 Tax=Halorussus salilacus TaxID=2953750 RepID=UPI00209D8E49|nr:hypothetical protein [Halorussus salilacus]USZ69870.1 hypothetical protein NGM10_15815 [Halorussus salilacus]